MSAGFAYRQTCALGSLYERVGSVELAHLRVKRELLDLVSHENRKKRRAVPVLCDFGGDSRSRTGDLLNAIQALYQLSYTPMVLVWVRGFEPPAS